MSLNKKVLAVAIAGSLFAAGNAAAVTLGTSAQGGTGPAVFAKEIVVADPVAGVNVATTAVNGALLSWQPGWSFSNDEVRYARVECSSNIRLSGVLSSSVPATVNFGTINGAGTNVLTFSVTSTGANVAANDVFTLTSATQNISNTDNVVCTTSLYDQPSQAQAGGEVGRIAGSVRTGTYLAFADSYRLTSTARTAISSVEAAPSFSSFRTAAAAAPFAGDTAARAELAALGVGLIAPTGTAVAQAAPYTVGGAAIALNDVLAATSTVIVDGDFSAAANANGTYTGAALGRVQLNGANATALSATSATFALPLPGGLANAVLSLTRRDGAVIPAAEYTARLNAVAAAPTVYAAAGKGPVNAGQVVRDGTELQAPLAQIPDGWYSRVILTNTSGVERPYTISVMTEKDVTVATGTLTGTIPANGTKVIDDVKDIFTGHNRATLNVSVAGPTNAIQGMYQIVNPTSGSISNETMVRPGSN